MLLGAFLLLNHFGKIECKGDGVSVTELRGHKIQGQLVTLRANKKSECGQHLFLCLKPKSYIDVGVCQSRVVDVSGKKTESSSETR